MAFDLLNYLLLLIVAVVHIFWRLERRAHHRNCLSLIIWLSLRKDVSKELEKTFFMLVDRIIINWRIIMKYHIIENIRNQRMLEFFNKMFSLLRRSLMNG